MADPVRIGMIGVGQIGKSHLRRYAEIKEATIVAAADIDEGELERVAEEHAISGRYADYRDLLARDDLDAVDVCLHNRLHAPTTITALEAGKHVYCEKPIAASYAEGKRMVDAAAATGKWLHVQLDTLFSMATKAARRLIDDGALGRIYHARSTGYRRRGRPFVDGYGTANFVRKEVAAGGAMFDMGVYHIAQLVYLLGIPEARRITGKTYQETGMDPARREESGYNVEELGVGFVRFEDGLTLDIIEAWAAHIDPFEGSCLLGASGGIRLDPFAYYTTLTDMDVNGVIDLEALKQRWQLMDAGADAYDSSQRHWVAALQGRVELLPSATIALETMLIQEGIYLSERLGREVTREEVTAG